MGTCARLQLQTAVGCSSPHLSRAPFLAATSSSFLPSSPAGRPQDLHSKTRKSGKLGSFLEEIPPHDMLGWAGVPLDANTLLMAAEVLLR